MIERVGRLASQLEANAFFEGDVLEQRQIHALKARSLGYATAGISRYVHAGGDVRKTRRVEPLKTGVGSVLIGIAHHIGARASRARSQNTQPGRVGASQG